jgi:hypothetical protein
MVTSMRLLAVALAAGGALLMGYSGQLSAVWPDLGQFDWFLLAGLVLRHHSRSVGPNDLGRATWMRKTAGN